MTLILSKKFIFDNDFLRTEYYNNALEILSVFLNKKDTFFIGDELNYDFDNSTEINQISFSFSPIIQSKIVESKFDVSKDANNIINKINELQALGTMEIIPDFFKKLFVIEGLFPHSENQPFTKAPLMRQKILNQLTVSTAL
ncbi:MAG: hypothetical protein IPG39_22140 [Bacteroidetes bacterium]|nr:hypothetical protein [Bacteroidota bacterium]